jgi:hypothetical protein
MRDGTPCTADPTGKIHVNMVVTEVKRKAILTSYYKRPARSRRLEEVTEMGEGHQSVNALLTTDD